MPHAAAPAQEHMIPHVFKVFRTGLLITGGMANKLFGLGMMGFLVFQSMKTMPAAAAEDPKKKRQELTRSPKLGNGTRGQGRGPQARGSRSSSAPPKPA